MSIHQPTPNAGKLITSIIVLDLNLDEVKDTNNKIHHESESPKIVLNLTVNIGYLLTI